MGLYQAVAGAKITAAEWNTYYNLLKGVVGGEDTVKLANNVADTLLLAPNDSPASPVKLFRVSQEPDWPGDFAVRSDGAIYLGDQYGTPGSLENGLIWRNGAKFYGRLNGATVELFTPSFFHVAASAFVSSTGTPFLEDDHNHVCWLLDKAAIEAVSGGCEIPHTGTVTLYLVQSNPLATTGNVRWQLSYKVVSANTAFGARTAAYATAAVPAGNDNWNKVSMVTGLAVTAGQQLSLLAGRVADHADDTADADVGLVGVSIQYA